MTINSPHKNAEGKVDVHYIFLAVDKPEYEHGIGLVGALVGADVRSVQGCYNGQEERALFLKGTDYAKLIHVGAHAMWQDQESVLALGGPLNGDQDRRHAHLLFANGDVEYIGIFQPVTEEVARAAGSWTRMNDAVGDGQTYFTCIREQLQ